MQPSVFAEVKTILLHGVGSAPDASLERFSPPDPEHFGANAQILIGEVGDEAADSFDVFVCTPSWAAHALAEGGWRERFGSLESLPENVLPGSGFWFMPSWDQEAFRSAVYDICADASPGPDWGSVAARIGRLIPWEFDYRYDAHLNAHFGERFPARPKGRSRKPRRSRSHGLVLREVTPLPHSAATEQKTSRSHAVPRHRALPRKRQAACMSITFTT